MMKYSISLLISPKMNFPIPNSVAYAATMPAIQLIQANRPAAIGLDDRVHARVERRPREQVDARQGLLVDDDGDGDLDRREAADADLAQRGPQVPGHDQAAVRPREADRAVDRRALLEAVAEVQPEIVDLDVAVGPRPIGEEAGDVLLERGRGAARRHRRRGCGAGSSAPHPVSSTGTSVAATARSSSA